MTYFLVIGLVALVLSLLGWYWSENSQPDVLPFYVFSEILTCDALRLILWIVATTCLLITAVGVPINASGIATLKSEVDHVYELSQNPDYVFDSQKVVADLQLKVRKNYDDADHWYSFTRKADLQETFDKVMKIPVPPVEKTKEGLGLLREDDE